MKKIILFSIAGVFVAAAAFGYGTSLPTGLSGKLSTNVQLDYKAGTGNAGYSAATYHTQGTRSFGSSSGDAAIYYQDATAVAAPTAPVGTASADFTGWSTL